MILAQIGRVDDTTITEVVRLHGALRLRAQDLNLARIARAREDAANQLTKTWDLTAWQTTTGRPDTESRVAKEPVESNRLMPPEIVDLHAIAATPLGGCRIGWAPSARGRNLLEARRRGVQRLEYELTPDWIDLGLDAALPPILKLKSQIGEFGRGERAQAQSNQLIVRAVPGIPTRISIVMPPRRLVSVITRSA